MGTLSKAIAYIKTYTRDKKSKLDYRVINLYKYHLVLFTKKLKNKTMEFGYWGIQGLGEGIKYMINAQDKIEVNCKTYTTKEDWFEKDKLELAKLTDFPNLPYLKLKDGKIVTQSGAIYRCVGRCTGFESKDCTEQLNCEIVSGVIDDLLLGFLKLLFDKDNFEKNKKTTHDGLMNGKIKELNNYLAKNKFCSGGESLTWCDFKAFHVLMVFCAFSKQASEMENFQTFFKNVKCAGGEKFRNYFETVYANVPVFMPNFLAWGGATFKDLKHFDA